jgi:hypothetical protein
MSYQKNCWALPGSVRVIKGRSWIAVAHVVPSGGGGAGCIVSKGGFRQMPGAGIILGAWENRLLLMW